MIRSKLMLCADAIIIDAKSNNVSVFNIIEQFTPESLPIFIARFTVLVVLERDPNDPSTIECSLRITLNHTSILDQIITSDFQDKKRNHSIITLSGLPITQPGTLKTSYWLDENELDHYVIDVNEPRQVQPSVTSHEG
jgi:hypothetical protein